MSKIPSRGVQQKFLIDEFVIYYYSSIETTTTTKNTERQKNHQRSKILSLVSITGSPEILYRLNKMIFKNNQGVLQFAANAVLLHSLLK